MWYSHWIDLKYKSYYFWLSFVLTLSISLGYKDIPVFLISKSLLNYNKSFIFTKITTGFLVYFKVSVGLTLLITLPLVIMYIYLFLLKSFYNYQLRLFKISSTLLLIYYIVGCYSMYLFLFKYLISFLLVFERTEGFLIILLEAKVDEFVNFWGQIVLSFLVLFVTLIITLGLNLTHFLRNFYLRFYFWILFYCIIVTITPPDFIFHFLFFLFFLFFFESTLYLLLFINFLKTLKSGESRIRTYDEY